MVSQQDIAKKLGVSGMTVSRALRGLPSVKRELAEQIHKTAEELGYRKDPLIQSLMAQRRRRGKKPQSGGLTVAWLGGGGPAWTEAYNINPDHLFNLYYEGARERLEKAGFNLMSFAIPKYIRLSPARLGHILQARGIPGIILGPNVDDRSFWVENPEAFALIQTGRSRHIRGVDRVTIDSFHAMTECMIQLKKVGYQRIGFFDGGLHNLRNERRWEAAFAINQAVKVPIPPLLISEERSFTPQALVKYVVEWQLDAVVSGRKQVHEWLCSYKTCSHLGFANPSLINAKSRAAGVVVDFERIGATAAELLIDSIHAGRRGLHSSSRTLSITGNWHQGELAPAVRASV
jgi:DNA-binding LacI/PurR family transcriptional regulator